MQNKKLCLSLVGCESEAEVIDILKKNDLWDNPKVWRYYGDNENNYGTIGNQQSRPEAAIVEKIINSVDAVLMAECLRRKIDPESLKAPQSIRDALVVFFNIYEGKLSNITPKARGRLAENICLVATGAKTNPCYSIIDKGEGQTPRKMPDTILSIGKSNKLRVPFVQGTFNMGGTGVFRFCGQHNLQLIISKRHPAVAKSEKDDSKGKWGFTVVRRERPHDRIKNSTHTYLAPSNNVLCFEANGLPLLPGNYPDAYCEKLDHGTFIKLYEYQMTGLKTAVYYDLYYRLSLLIPNIALPVRFFERRKGYSAHSYEITMSGLSVRLEEDKFQNLEDNFPTSSTLSAQGQKMKASIYAFKRGQSTKYTKDEGIIFTVNGQTHAHLSKAFFCRKAVGMGYLDDSLLVIVDCTDFDSRYREDLFMNSRDRLCSGALRSEIERNLEDLLRNHQGLKQLKERRRREEIEDKLEDSKPLADIIEKILKKSPTLSKLFVDGVRLPNPFKVVKAKGKKIYEGKKFPTYFTLTKKYSAENPKNCAINAKFRVQYKTDATNDYFDRDKEPGAFSLNINGEVIQEYSLNLWNGTASLNVKLPRICQVGDLIRLKSCVNDISRVEPLEEELYVKVCYPTVKPESQPGKRKPPSSDEEGDDVEKTPYLDLPNIREVRRDQWHRRSFGAESALDVIDSGEHGYDFYVNMDNIHLRTEQKVATNGDSKLLDARYKYGMVLIGIALLKDHETRNEKNLSDDDEDIFKKIRYVTRVVSPILLPMIASLGDLEVEKATQAYEEN